MWCNPNFCGEYKLAGRALLATTTVPGETRRLAWVNYAARSEREAAADGKKMCSVDIRMSDSGAIQYQNRSILSPPIFIPNSSRYVDETRYVLRSPEISAAWLEEDHCFRFKNYFRPQGRFFGFVY
jgi:hypothetical protein